MASKPTVWHSNELLDPAQLKVLLEHGGADPNKKNQHGWPPIMSGGPEHMAVLLDHGADPNATVKLGGRNGDPYRRTALHMMADVGNKAMCEKLLDAGALIDATDWLGKTALCYAWQTTHKGQIKTDYADLVELFVMRGSSISMKNDYGETVLDIARLYGGTRATELVETRSRYEAEQSKKQLLEGLGAAWKPSDCKESTQPCNVEQPERQVRKRLM